MPHAKVKSRDKEIYITAICVRSLVLQPSSYMTREYVCSGWNSGFEQIKADNFGECVCLCVRDVLTCEKVISVIVALPKKNL